MNSYLSNKLRIKNKRLLEKFVTKSILTNSIMQNLFEKRRCLYGINVLLHVGYSLFLKQFYYLLSNSINDLFDKSLVNSFSFILNIILIYFNNKFYRITSYELLAYLIL